MNNRIRSCWREGKAAVNFWLSMPSTVSAEIAARQDLDGVTVDLQHGLIDYFSALPMLQVMSQGDATPMARVPWLEPGIIMKLLDAGALGIICPMINNAEEARRLVGYCSYAPAGERSFGPTRALPLYGADYPKLANAELVILAMVETNRHCTMSARLPTPRVSLGFTSDRAISPYRWATSRSWTTESRWWSKLSKPF